jgi:hypothetical protein
MKQTTNDRIDMQQRNLLRLTPQTQHDRHAYDEFKKVDEMFDPSESSGVFDAETRLRFPCREGFSFWWELDKSAAARTRPSRISIVGGFMKAVRRA